MAEIVLITGGSGFIGRQLVAYYNQKKGYIVESPSSHELDLLDEKNVANYLNRLKPDYVLHCATHNATITSDKDNTLVLENNLKMYFHLAKNHDCYGKMLSFGSGAQYSRAYMPPFTEENFFGTHIPTEAYALSKYIIAKDITTGGYNNIYDLRLFGVFGAYEDWRIRFISNAIVRALYNLPITINQNVAFDYLWITDLYKITEWFLQNTPRYRMYNVCTGRQIELLYVAQMIRDVSELDVPIIVKRGGMAHAYSGNNERLMLEMKNFSFSETEHSIRTLCAWYKKHLSDFSIAEIIEDTR